MNKDHEKIAQAIVQGLTPFFVQQKDKTEALEESIKSLKIDDPVTKTLRSVFRMAEDKGVVEDIKSLEQNEDGSFKVKPVEVTNLAGLEEAQKAIAKEFGVYAKQINETLEKTNLTLSQKDAITDGLLAMFTSKVEEIIATTVTTLTKSTLKVEVQNPQTFPEKIMATVSNLSEIVFPKFIKISNSEPKDAIPVRLVDRNGKKFYDAIFEVVARSGEINLSALGTVADSVIQGNQEMSPHMLRYYMSLLSRDQSQAADGSKRVSVINGLTHLSITPPSSSTNVTYWGLVQDTARMSVALGVINNIK